GIQGRQGQAFRVLRRSGPEEIRRQGEPRHGERPAEIQACAMTGLVWIVEIVILALLIFSAYYCYYSWKTGVPTVSTSKAVRQKIAALVPEGPRKIVEMGSGWGGLAITVAKARPDCEVLAIEYSIVPALVARLRKALDPSLKNLE